MFLARGWGRCEAESTVRWSMSWGFPTLCSLLSLGIVGAKRVMLFETMSRENPSTANNNVFPPSRLLQPRPFLISKCHSASTPSSSKSPGAKSRPTNPWRALCLRPRAPWGMPCATTRLRLMCRVTVSSPALGISAGSWGSVMRRRRG